jgi:hypothetical protein
MGWFQRPPPVPEKILEEQEAREVERESRSVDDLDDLRDDPALVGHGGWLVVLLGILGIAGLFIFLYLMSGIL